MYLDPSKILSRERGKKPHTLISKDDHGEVTLDSVRAEKIKIKVVVE